MAGNYEKMEQDARALFLKADQRLITECWELESDADYIYVEFFSQRLKIDRKTAEITAAEGDALLCAPANGRHRSTTVNESMILFDILTRTGARPAASGQWASISVLGGVIGQGHDRILNHQEDAARFAGRTEELKKACEALGGVPESRADAGYSFEVFKDFRILFQFWDADDEFPASIKYLFDANALQYMHYETLWYVMGALYDRILNSYNIALANSSR